MHKFTATTPRSALGLLCLGLLLTLASPAFAHFGMVIPSSDMVTDKKDAGITLQLAFAHPMEQQGMPLARPRSFKVYADGASQDLTASLKSVRYLGKEAWTASYTFRRPGVSAFVMEPVPYWEPAEDCFIQHFTKVYAAAFGEEEGWEKPLGLRTEIVPLTRPFGNYAGNVFQGQVLVNGKPAPGTEVEIEYLNTGGRYTAPTEYMVTQVVRADPNGVFTVALPMAGWWGFAALTTSDTRMDHEGTPKDVELGAVLWIRTLAPRMGR